MLVCRNIFKKRTIRLYSVAISKFISNFSSSCPDTLQYIIHLNPAIFYSQENEIVRESGEFETAEEMTKKANSSQGYGQLVHMRIRYHSIANLHITLHHKTRERRTETEKRINKPCRIEVFANQSSGYIHGLSTWASLHMGLTAEYPATRTNFHVAGYAVRRN